MGITSFDTVRNVANTKQSLRQTSRTTGRGTLTETGSLSLQMDRSARGNLGPSQRLVAWRRFLVESLVCVVLIGVIVLAAVRGLGGVLIGPFVVTVAAAIVRIVRCEP